MSYEEEDTCVYTREYACACERARACSRGSVFQKRKHIHTYMQTCMHTCVCVYVYTYTHAAPAAYMHMHKCL